MIVGWLHLSGQRHRKLVRAHARLTAPVRQIAWGDWTRQGLPFYAGNVTYRATVRAVGEALTLEAAHFRAPLLTLDLDSQRLGTVAFAPYQVELPDLTPGLHHLDLTAYGSRVNAFGPLHNANPDERWFGPSAWRTQGAHWADEYQLKPAGILVAPRLLARARHRVTR